MMLAWCSISVTTTGVAGGRGWPAPGLGHQVERLGGVLGEDDLATVGRVDEPGLTLSRAPSRASVAFDRQLVRTPVHVGVVGLVVVGHRIDDLVGLLRRVGRVEVDQRLAVDLGCDRIGKSALMRRRRWLIAQAASSS